MTVIELLAKQAAEQRELSRARATEATDAKPAVEQAAAAMTSSRKAVEALEDQLAELHRAIAETEQAIADAQGTHQRTTDAHAEALATVAAHEAEAQQAADIAESLDRIAKQMRDARPEPPHEALAATVLMTEPPKVVEASEAPCPVCLAPMPGPHNPGCARIDEVLDDLATPDDSPFTAVPADPGTVARVTNALPVTAPPTPDEPDPGVTMPDLGPARPPLDPPPGHGVHTHAKPSDGLMSRLTGGWPVVGRRRTDEQDGSD